MLLARLADRHGVREFVSISTDKAVNPTSVMGCSKLLAERFVQALSGGSGTKFIVVRFGNVLGSRGSVLSIFAEQVARGGPITVTHPDVSRYFMTVQEAVRLTIYAGAIGSSGEVLVLDMGEPVRILDLAQQMIRLAGLRPGEDIEIEIVGADIGRKVKEISIRLYREASEFAATKGINFSAIDPDYLLPLLALLAAGAAGVGGRRSAAGAGGAGQAGVVGDGPTHTRSCALSAANLERGSSLVRS